MQMLNLIAPVIVECLKCPVFHFFSGKCIIRIFNMHFFNVNVLFIFIE